MILIWHEVTKNWEYLKHSRYDLVFFSRKHISCPSSFSVKAVIPHDFNRPVTPWKSALLSIDVTETRSSISMAAARCRTAASGCRGNDRHKPLEWLMDSSSGAQTSRTVSDLLLPLGEVTKSSLTIDRWPRLGGGEGNGSPENWRIITSSDDVYASGGLHKRAVALGNRCHRCVICGWTMSRNTSPSGKAVVIGDWSMEDIHRAGCEMRSKLSNDYQFYWLFVAAINCIPTALIWQNFWHLTANALGCGIIVIIIKK